MKGGFFAKIRKVIENIAIHGDLRPFRPTNPKGSSSFRVASHLSHSRLFFAATLSAQAALHVRCAPIPI
jgi:hypothetical protein